MDKPVREQRERRIDQLGGPGFLQIMKKPRYGREERTRKSIGKLRAETDRFARQAKRIKEQLDKVQDAADTLAEKANQDEPA